METIERITVDGMDLEFRGTCYACRCAVAIADTNIPDAEWAFEVLNRYGHLVRHPADDIAPLVALTVPALRRAA